MRCPRCGFEQPEDIECGRCGIVFAKWEARRRQAHAADAPTARAAAPGATSTADTGPPRPRRPLLGPSRSSVRDASVGLARMLRSGLGAPEALRTLAGGAGGSLGAALEDMAARLESGASLAEAVARHPAVFSDADVQTVRAGERIGESAAALEAVAERLDGRLAIRRQLWRSAAYPLFVLAASIVITPIPQLVLGSAWGYASAVLRNLAVAAVVGVAVVVGLPRLLATRAVGVRLRRLAWRLPWPATVYRHAVRATFCHVLARNLSAGLSVFESARTAAAATGDDATVEAAERAAASLTGGAGLAESLGAEGLIPRGDLMVLLSGEKAGTVDESLSSLGDAYRDRIGRGLRALVTAFGVLVTLAIFIYVALGILEAWESVQGTTQELFDTIDRETPYMR
ncbi:MAG: type II secretion system F family protein [Myxococcota bacterium]